MYTLNVGSGERVYKEYPVGSGFTCINYDARDLIGYTDVVGDVRQLPWPNEYFQTLLCSDILEHFPLKDTVNILKEWCRVLKVGGVIEFRVPNLTAICNHYNKYSDATHVSWLLYGGQDYSGNFHYICFDRKMLTDLCEQVGLSPIEYREEGTNFILLAKKQ